jgi:hypothetical protein
MSKPAQEPKPKSPFDWRGPTLLDWSPAGISGNKFASKDPTKNSRPQNTPWKTQPATQGGRDYLEAKKNKSA